MFRFALAGAAVALSPEDLFKEFETKFEKTYTSLEERAGRFAIFTENLANIAVMKAADDSAEYSHLSPLADWSVAEFSARNTLQVEDKPATVSLDDLDVTDLPTSYDWRTEGAVTPVKNQGQCGSCWAFATVANIEGVNFKATKSLVSLSEQELVDCDTVDQGCGGGLPSNGMNYLKENKLGEELETDYAYTGAGGKCSAVAAKEKVFVSDYVMVANGALDEDKLAAALIKYGPLAIGINATPMQWYMGGIANPFNFLCNPKSLDHGVAIVGFGVEGTKKYWIIKNSWGPSWGEKGYYRIIRGTGKCGLNTNVASAVVSATAPLPAVVV